MKAIRVLTRLPNGTMGVIWVDAITGLLVTDLTGYELVGEGGKPLNPDGSEKKDSTPAVEDGTKEDINYKNSSTGDAAEGTESVFGNDAVFSNPGESAKTSLSKGTTNTQTKAATESTQPTSKSETTAGTASNQTVDSDLGPAKDVSWDNHGVRSGKGPKTEEVAAMVQQAVTETLGKGYTVSVGSGMGAKGSSRHRSEDDHSQGEPGKASAIDATITGPDGKTVTDKSMIDAVNQTAAAKGLNVGIGSQSYMNPATTHYDAVPTKMQDKMFDPGVALGITPMADPKAGTVWGGNPSSRQAVMDAQRTGVMASEVYDKAAENAPTPSSRGFNTNVNPDAVGSIADGVKSAFSDDNYSIDTSQKSMTPAEAAAAGYVSRTAEERGTLAETLAGELGPNTLAALEAREPGAIAEARAMIDTAENRSGAKGKSLTDTLTAGQGSQYNAQMASKMGVTQGNFSKYGGVLSALVDDHYAGLLGPAVAPRATHYYNPTISNPNWSGLGKAATTIGQHTFLDDVTTADRSKVEYDYTGAMFSPTSPNVDMSLADQMSQQGLGRSVAESSRQSSSAASKGVNSDATYGGFASETNDAGWGGKSGSTGGNANSPNAGGGRSGTSAADSTSGKGDAADFSGGLGSTSNSGSSRGGIGSDAGATGLGGSTNDGTAGRSEANADAGRGGGGSTSNSSSNSGNSTSSGPDDGSRGGQESNSGMGGLGGWV